MTVAEKIKSNLVTFLNNIEQGRPAEINGEQFTVYPVVILTEGVHSGSGGPTLYTASELSKFVEAWNGVPVTLQHPDENGIPVSANSPEIYERQVMGTLFNTVYENGKLKAEIWLRNTMIDLLDPGLKNRLINGERLEVSTGLFCEDNVQDGTFNNVEYSSIAVNIRPDHLALLPGGIGACSWEDGCGVRANKKGGGDSMIIRRKESVKANEGEKQWDRFFVNTEEFSINEMEYTQIVSLLSEKVDSMDVRGEKYNYLKKVYPSYVIYSVHYRDSNDQNKTVKRNYRIVNDTVEWVSDPVQVTENVTYTEINNNAKKESAMEKVKTMRECCPDKVEELIKNNSNFTEEHKESLLTMTEDQFALTINVSKDLKIVDDAEKLTDNETKEENQITMNDLPADLRESVEYGKKVLAQNKAKLVDTIKANKNNQFTDAELEGFDLDMLERLSKMAPTPTANYTANGGGNISQETGVEPLPISNSWEDEKK